MKKKYLKNFSGRLFTTAFIALLQIIAFVVSIGVLGSYTLTINAALTIVSIIVVVIIINQPKNPAYKLVWTILILTLPLFGGLLYLAASLQSSTFRFRKKAKIASEVIEPYMRQELAVTDEMRRQSRTKSAHASYLSNKASFPVYKNTSSVYLPSGEAMFEWLKKELSTAQHFIFLEFFIIQEGVMWDSILKILIAKVKEGVDVRLIWDGMGCMSTLPKNYDKTLENLGIKVMIFNPFIPLATIIQNNRDHRKIVVIDGHTAFTGGVNLADEYINAYDRFGHWKDSAIMLRGDAVKSFTMMFLETWYTENKVDSNIEQYICTPAKNGFIVSDRSTSGFAQPYADTPLDGECVGELVYFNLINKAKEYIYITTPYLIPDNELITALCFAAKSGIDVRIITPKIPDKWYVFQVTRGFYGQLLNSGVKIYEYTPGFIHSKICVSDDSIGVVGSINFDYRSLYLHFECAALIYDNPTVYDIKRDFLETLKVSEEITPEIYKKIRRKSGLIMSVLRIFAPLF
ncbi:MAG: cardiolipin synthase [Clostridiales bacterium]|nr:cardiolipin synthase [Clostridiales bacterium]